MAGKAEVTKEGGFFLKRWFRALFQWVIGWADTKYAEPALGAISFAESSFFPIPPDFLLLPMGIGRPEKAIRFGAITWATSVLGGMVGYLIGWVFFDTIGLRIIEFYGVMDKYFTFRELFDRYNFAIIMVAGLTPLPYKVFTITAGVAVVNFPVFMLGSILSRGVRFMSEGAILYYGDYLSRRVFKMPVKDVLDKYLEPVMITAAAAGVLGFMAVSWALPGHESRAETEASLAGGGKTTLVLAATEVEGQKGRVEYGLSAMLGGSTVKAGIPGGPFLEPRRGGVSIEVLPAGTDSNVVAAVYHSELPPSEHGTMGHVAFFAIDGNRLVHLRTLDFTRYLLNEGGAWSEGKATLSADEPDGGAATITATVEVVNHASAKAGEDETVVEKFHYKLVDGELVEVGRDGPEKAPAPE